MKPEGKLLHAAIDPFSLLAALCSGFYGLFFFFFFDVCMCMHVCMYVYVCGGMQVCMPVCMQI